jgi:penicillin-binding protein 1A
MKKAYFIYPLIALAAFGVIYWNTISEFDAREQQKAKEKRVALEEKKKAEYESRKKAIEEANALQERRKVEKAEREARAQREKQAELDLNDARDKARDDRDRALRQVDRLRAEHKIESEALEKIAKDRQVSIDEEAFLQKYIKQAEENQKNLQEVLVKIAKADEEAAKAAAIAAAAKKKS